jgi:tetratricopeptide (TPR) repeat protein
VADSLEREIQGLRALLHTDRDPEGRAFVPLADAYRRARDLDRALEVVSIGLERHPTLASAYVVEAWVHQDRGDSNGAAAAWERVLELDADNIEALRGLGSLLAGAGHAARAAPLLDKARALDAQPAPRLVAEASPEAEVSLEEQAAQVVQPTPPAPAAPVTPPAQAPPTASEAPAPSTLSRPPTPSMPRSAATVVETPARGRPPIETQDFNEGEPEEPPSELPATRTLAELYARQGLHERAAQVYQKLLADHPHDAGLRQRLAELSAGGAHPASAHGAGVHDEDTEVLARALADRPGPVEPSDSPFAWGGEEAAPEPSPPAGHTISGYFRSILDWSSARQAEPAAEAAIEASAAATVVETVAVEAAPVGAPSVPEATPATQRVVPIESLAPGKVVPIAALAPDVVPVMTLAPEAVPIETLAPRGPAASSSRS